MTETFKQPNDLGIEPQLGSTEERRLDDPNRTTARWFRSLTEQAPVGIFLTDAHGGCKFVNQRWQEMTGLTADEARGSGWTRAIHPDDNVRLFAEWSTATLEGHEFASEYRFRTSAGRVTWVQGSAVPLRDEHGQVTEFLGSVTDITERRQAEIALRESEERFRRVQEASPEGFVLLRVERGPDGRVEDFLHASANSAAVRIMGHDLCGRRVVELYPSVRASPSWEAYLRVAAGGPPEILEHHYQADGLDGWYRNLIVRLGEDEIAVMFSDVTARRKTAEQTELLALENARLYAAETRAREEERTARERLMRIQALASTLATALTREDVARIAVEEGCATLGAVVGVLYAVDPDDHLRLVWQKGVPDEARVDVRDIPLDSPLPSRAAVRTRRPIWVESPEQYEAEWPELAALVKAPTGMNAFATIPLLVEGECLGTLAFGYLHAHPFSEADRTFISLIVHHCAQGLFRARWLERERRYRDRLRVLADAGDLLAATIDYETTLQNVLQIALPTLADFCFLDVVEDSGEVRRLPWANEAPEITSLLRPTRWVRSEQEGKDLFGLSSGRSGFHPDINDAWIQGVAAGSEHLDLLRMLAPCSMITVPLLSQGELLGALTLCHGRSGRHHTSEDLSLAEELARRAAQAVRHARLYLTSQAATRRAQEAAQQADEASRLKEEFLATVSHELRTPLSAILGWTTILGTERRADAAVISKATAVIERNARSQLRIIEDILDVSRIIRGQLRVETEPVDLDRIGRDVLESVRPSAAAKEIELVYASSDEPCRIVGDPERLRQILWNLLSNAVKFTRPGGEVRLSIAPDRGKMVLSVRDTGQGIDPAFVPHVFERFRQGDGSTTRSSGGLGLGLAIVRHLTEMHGGTVTAESEGLEKGATFTVTLPVKAFSAPVRSGAREAAGATWAVASSSPLQGMLEDIRVLVAEDEDDARELIELLLSEAGAVVKTASSAERALVEVADFDPHVLVSDIGMPGHDGYWLVEAIRKQRPQLPAIALTAFARSEDARRALAAGFDYHLGKPIDPKQLVEIVASCRAPRI